MTVAVEDSDVTKHSYLNLKWHWRTDQGRAYHRSSQQCRADTTPRNYKKTQHTNKQTITPLTHNHTLHIHGPPERTVLLCLMSSGDGVGRTSPFRLGGGRGDTTPLTTVQSRLKTSTPSISLHFHFSFHFSRLLVYWDTRALLVLSTSGLDWHRRRRF